MSRLSRAFACAALLSAVVRAQEPAPPARAAAAPAARIELALTGGKGRAAPEPTKEDVRVYVDGVERPVVSFEKETRPVSYGLVVDNSGSVRSQIGRVVDAAQSVVARNGPDDEAFVLRFVSSDNMQIMQTLTADRSALDRALYSMFIQGGQTALLDALYMAGEYLMKNARRTGATGRGLALVLVSDGEDRESSHKAEEVLKLLRDGGVRVFCVGLTEELENTQGFITKSKRDAARRLLSKLAEETGGRVFYAGKDGQLGEAVGDAAGNMRTRYVVGYAPPEPGGKGPGKVEVKLVGAPGKEKLRAQILEGSRQ
ncbi:MAG TPA: VWA domain-containing protein [Pyrinomonadaceae bacterium]|jgi:VWFA-related protein